MIVRAIKFITISSSSALYKITNKFVISIAIAAVAYIKPAANATKAFSNLYE